MILLKIRVFLFCLERQGSNMLMVFNFHLDKTPPPQQQQMQPKPSANNNGGFNINIKPMASDGDFIDVNYGDRSIDSPRHSSRKGENSSVCTIL